MPSVCRECREDLEHCHGTLIHHALSAVECTEDCATPEAVHAFSIDCVAIGCVCSVTISASAVS
jgi:hypothetical protein